MTEFHPRPTNSDDALERCDSMNPEPNFARTITMGARNNSPLSIPFRLSPMSAAVANDEALMMALRWSGPNALLSFQSEWADRTAEPTGERPRTCFAANYAILPSRRTSSAKPTSLAASRKTTGAHRWNPRQRLPPQVVRPDHRNFPRISRHSFSSHVRLELGRNRVQRKRALRVRHHRSHRRPPMQIFLDAHQCRATGEPIQVFGR